MTAHARAPHTPAAPIEAGGHITLFGYDPTPATVRLQPRSRSWRVGGAIRTMVLGILVAVPVAIVPPHAPWIIGALAGAAFLARRRWTERFTVVGMQATCPRCGGAMKAAGGRLRAPHPASCEACNFEASVEIPDEALTDAGD